MILRARTILPLTQSPIEDGAVRIAGNRIAAVGKWRDLKAQAGAAAMDLGEIVLLPGLINAHCHLDYTDMRGQIPRPKFFPDWIKTLLTLKAEWTYSDYAQSWLHGARMLVRSGVTSVANIEAVPELLPDVWSATPLRVFSLVEMTGVKRRRPASEILQEAVNTIDTLPASRGWPGLSPHAPYSTSPELLRLSGDLARQRAWRLAVHVAESIEEFELFLHRRGPLFDWLKNQRNMADCGRGSPVRHLERNGLLGENLMAVHVNYLAAGDADLLARHRVHVVHCPRSHFYFQHAPFPFRDLSAAGVNVTLGTDSLASVQANRRQKPELDMFAEMRAFQAGIPGVSPKSILQMATVSAARALGWPGQIGELSVGALADLIGLPFGGSLDTVYEATLGHCGDVSVSMIDGRWAHPPPDL